MKWRRSRRPPRLDHCSRRPAAPLQKLQVSFVEVTSLRQKRLTGNSRQRIGKAISKIQSGGMPPLSVFSPRLPRNRNLLFVNRDNLDGGLLNQHIQFATTDRI